MARAITGRITANLVAGIVITVGTVLVTVSWMAHKHNEQAAISTETMVAGGVQAMGKRLASLANDYGWWEEAYEPGIGWAMEGVGEADADALYRLLEDEVVPAYADGEVWLRLMRASIARVGGRFTSARMVAEYVQRFYLPAHRGSALAAR